MLYVGNVGKVGKLYVGNVGTLYVGNVGKLYVRLSVSYISVSSM